MDFQLVSRADMRLVKGGAGIVGRVGVTYIDPATGDHFRWDAERGVAVPISSPTLLPGEMGFVGRCTADNFGTCWVATPINWGASSGTAAGTRLDRTAELAGTERAGWTKVFFGFDANDTASGLFTAGTTTVVANRLADLQYILQFWHAKSVKVLLTLDGPLTASAPDMALYRDRLIVMYTLLNPTRLVGTRPDLVTYIDAIQGSNEPYAALVANFGIENFVAQGCAKVAEQMRVTYLISKAMSPRTLVVMPPFQGGEGSAVEAVWAASSAGVAVRGDGGGTGTRGEMFFDKGAFHPYPIATTIALANAALTSSSIEATMRQYSGFIKTAIANRRANPLGAVWWAGKPDPGFWATEFAVSPNGGNITANTDFRMQFYTLPQRADLLLKRFMGIFGSGYELGFDYAVDHSGDIGPWTPGAKAAAANGIDIRLTACPVPCFDGDDVLFYVNEVANPVFGTVMNANNAGTAFDVLGVPFSYTPNYMTANRWLLGGSHQVWAAVQAFFTGDIETGFYASGNAADPYLPHIRDSFGQVRRSINGKLTPVMW
jgi:hypothetical protein